MVIIEILKDLDNNTYFIQQIKNGHTWHKKDYRWFVFKNGDDPLTDFKTIREAISSLSSCYKVYKLKRFNRYKIKEKLSC